MIPIQIILVLIIILFFLIKFTGRSYNNSSCCDKIFLLVLCNNLIMGPGLVNSPPCRCLPCSTSLSPFSSPFIFLVTLLAPSRVEVLYVAHKLLLVETTYKSMSFQIRWRWSKRTFHKEKPLEEPQSWWERRLARRGQAWFLRHQHQLLPGLRCVVEAPPPTGPPLCVEGLAFYWAFPVWWGLAFYWVFPMWWKPHLPYVVKTRLFCVVKTAKDRKLVFFVW